MIATREVCQLIGSVTVLREIRKVCQLVGGCDGHGGDVRRLWGGVTGVRKCGTPKGGMRIIRKLCQFRARCDGHGRDVKVLGEA